MSIGDFRVDAAAAEKLKEYWMMQIRAQLNSVPHGGGGGGAGNHINDFGSWLAALDELLKNFQDDYSATDYTFDIPQIEVLGSENIGKSAVLEMIVGHPVLPGGNKRVTKMVNEIRLRRSA